MRDWRRLVEDKLASMRLSAEDREEVVSELADHLVDEVAECLAKGLSEEAAEACVMSAARDWDALGKGIMRERRRAMSTFGKQFILPSGVALALATAALALETKLGPRPAVWMFYPGAFVLYKFWPLALLVAGSISAWLAMRAGASRGRRWLVAMTPALYMAGTMAAVLAVVTILSGLRVMPNQPIYWSALVMGLVNWVACPAVPLFVGALPFLFERRRSVTASS